MKKEITLKYNIIDVSAIKGGVIGKTVTTKPADKRCIHGVIVGQICFGCYVKNMGG